MSDLQLQLPRDNSGQAKEHRGAYNEAYPGFYAMDRDSLRALLAQWDREEWKDDWHSEMPWREAEREKGRRQAARDAERVRTYESWDKDRLGHEVRTMRRYSTSDENLPVAQTVYDRRFPRRAERSGKSRRSSERSASSSRR